MTKNIEEKLVPKPKSRFLKIKCLNCGNEQIVFGCATTTIKCDVCERQLVQTTGGKARVLTKISEVLN
jgi:small subunit ribosomal protein S27e